MNREQKILIGAVLLLAFCGTIVLFEFYEDSKPKKVLYNEKGEVAAVHWYDENGHLIGGYVRVENGWAVWSTEARVFVFIPEDRWSPPETDEPVTFEKFPPHSFSTDDS